MNKKTVSILGVTIGVIIIVIGFLVQGISVESYSVSIGRDIKFGADFYTEMYDVTQDVGHAVNAAQRTIDDAAEKVCDAIGWLIVVFGLFDVAYFACKVVACNEDGVRDMSEHTEKATASSYALQHTKTSHHATNTVANKPAAPLRVDEWACECGRVNRKYVTTCACGKKQYKKVTPAVVKEPETVKCPKCGNEHPKETTFCTGCGAKLN